ncbi:MAG: hypothetical protein IMZ65_01990 [Planctomycetes bacterium]|nr:hypothetical protein [Planctomycetota bacterium]
MAKQQPIWINCPQYMKRVRGSYDCDDSGRYRLGPQGEFALECAHCLQDEGRCAQPLCALHRFNRKGPGTWYPVDIVANPEPKKAGGG